MIHRRGHELVVLGGGLAGDFTHALGIEDVGFYLGFGALGGNLLAIPQKADARGVADARNDLAAGANGGVRGGNQSFLTDRLTIGGDGNPGSLSRADHQLKRTSRSRR
jgi:hypothetical protein